ncbi:MAG TPA: hypothetical protein VFD00_12470 [Thermoclostridium sp.]|nr:hypothetical protein [Thermoclostridium sp.]
MITIFTALYCEAEPIIRYFDLKRQNNINGFQLFSNNSIHLLITGVGGINAAIGVTSLCSSSINTPTFNDIVVNLGICGAENLTLKKGTILLGNKIIDLSTNKSYYPDMIFRHKFIESTILTSPVPVIGRVRSNDKGCITPESLSLIYNDSTENNASESNTSTLHNLIQRGNAKNVTYDSPTPTLQSCVHIDCADDISNGQLSSENNFTVTDLVNTDLSITDMEASGVFHAAKLFYQPHQMFFFKVVSDYQDGKKISKKEVSSLISNNISQIAHWILPIHDELLSCAPMSFYEHEKALLNKTAEELKLTVSMQFQLKGLMHYYKIKHGDFVNDLEQFLQKNITKPLKNKNEGKKYFEQLKESFL